MKNNENGYALLTVILLVLLFTTVGMGLLALNMNASKQFNHKEETVQARHYAEMGVLHYKAELGYFIETNSDKNDLSCSDFPQEASQSSDQDYNDYEVTVNCINESEDVKKITIESLGKVGGTDETIEAIFKVNRIDPTKKEDGSIPTPDDYIDSLKVIDEAIHEFPNGTYTQDEDSLHITNEMTASAGNSDGGNDILISRNLFVDQKINLNNHACVVVGGDLIVRGNIETKNMVYIFVYGDAYFNSYDAKPHAEIFISGEYYENGVLVDDHPYPPVPDGSVYYYGNENANGNADKSCTLGEANPGTPAYSWHLQDDVEVNYFK